MPAYRIGPSKVRPIGNVLHSSEPTHVSCRLSSEIKLDGEQAVLLLILFYAIGLQP